MIVKVATRKAGIASSFKRLANYITDAPQKGEKVLAQWSSNADGIDMEDAITSIQLEQQLCQSTKADKTYHLIVSFPTGERPGVETIKKIEQQLLDSVHLSDHQRISVVHDDTTHMHLHIAVNKVSAKTGKVVTPYRDYQRLNKAARAIEVEFGLKKIDKQENKQEKTNAKAADVESHSKIGSFQRWSKEALAKDINDLLNRKQLRWQEVHETLAKHGLVIKPKGRGLIVTTEDGKFFVKPSTIHRGFTRGKLEEKMGKFVAANVAVNRCKFTSKPLSRSRDSSALYDSYKEHRESLLHRKKEIFNLYKKEKEKDVAELKQDYASRRDNIWNDPLLTKKQKYTASKNLSLSRKGSLKLCSKKFAAQRAEIMEETKLPSWVEYLVARAENGDQIALKSLRNRKINYTPVGNHISGIPSVFNPKIRGTKYTVAKNGDVSYTLAQGKVVVGERAIHVYGSDQETMRMGLLIAKQRYGNSLKLNGDKTFIQSALAVADKNEINVETTRGMERG